MKIAGRPRSTQARSGTGSGPSWISVTPARRCGKIATSPDVALPKRFQITRHADNEAEPRVGVHQIVMLALYARFLGQWAPSGGFSASSRTRRTPSAPAEQMAPRGTDRRRRSGFLYGNRPVAAYRIS